MDDHLSIRRNATRPQVLKALYDAATPQGMGFYHYTPEPMTIEEAVEIIARAATRRDMYFDYLKGRVMKIDLANLEALCPRLYDRDNGDGAAARALEDAGLT